MSYTYESDCMAFLGIKLLGANEQTCFLLNLAPNFVLSSFFLIFWSRKCKNCKFQPAFGVGSIYTLIKIYNKSDLSQSCFFSVGCFCRRYVVICGRWFIERRQWRQWGGNSRNRDQVHWQHPQTFHLFQLYEWPHEPLLVRSCRGKELGSTGKFFPILCSTFITWGWFLTSWMQTSGSWGTNSRLIDKSSYRNSSPNWSPVKSSVKNMIIEANIEVNMEAYLLIISELWS